MTKTWKLYRKRRLPELKRRPFIRESKAVRHAAPLSCVCGRTLLPKHWSPKADADEAVRIREELAALAELERYTLVW